MNKPKKILIVTRFFHPEITPRAFRAFELSKEFAAQGHEVTVITTKKDYDYKQLQQVCNFTIKANVKKEPKELKGHGLIRAFRFALKYFFYYPFIWLMPSFKKELASESGYDLLISIAHPFSVHFGVALAKTKNKNLASTWIADCGDPFVGVQHRRIPYPFYYKWVENWFCKQVDYITVPIKEAIPAYPKKFYHKIRVIPQGFNFNEVAPNFKPGKNKVPTFCYAGNLSPGLRDPRPLLEFLAALDKKFKFLIYTKNGGFLKPYQEKLKEKLEVNDFVPRYDLLKELGQMDFLINLENKGTVQQPSKLIDYALLERPILSISPNALDRNRILDFLNGDYTQTLKVSNIQKYNITQVANRFLALV